MNINKNNYEAFFLDYYEGNLTPNEVAELLLFIEQHPEVKDEFESYENITLENIELQFENKADLKKEITLKNKDSYFIKAVESDLTKAEKDLLDKFLRQHPQLFSELELYKKTKLQADYNLVFENKDVLKQTYSPIDELIIAAIENRLSIPELNLLEQQLLADAQLKSDYDLFKKTKLVADTSIIFENKNALKRKEKKIIPLYYRIAAAAAILILFGLLFIFNNSNKKQEFANNGNKTQSEKTNSVNPVVLPYKNSSIKTVNESSGNVAVKNFEKVVQKNNTKKVNNTPKEVVNELENSVAVKQENIPLPTESIEPVIIKKEEPTLLADNNMKQKVESKNDFLSLKEMAAAKIKEKTLNDATIDNQKKNGRLKKFNLWDAAQVVANGISKIAGKEVIKVNPEYNEQGNVTAYALGAGGFEISKGK